MPKCTILSQKVKKFLGRGHSPSSDLTPIEERDTPPQIQPPRRLAPYLPTPQLFFSQFSHWAIALWDANVGVWRYWAWVLVIGWVTAPWVKNSGQ